MHQLWSVAWYSLRPQAKIRLNPVFLRIHAFLWTVINSLVFSPTASSPAPLFTDTFLAEYVQTTFKGVSVAFAREIIVSWYLFRVLTLESTPMETRSWLLFQRRLVLLDANTCCHGSQWMSIHKQAKGDQNFAMTTPSLHPLYDSDLPSLWVRLQKLRCQLRVNSPAAPIVSGSVTLAVKAWTRTHFEIDPRYPDNLAFYGGVRGQNEGHFVHGGWPLARNTRTDNRHDVVDDVLSSYSENFLMPQQSASQTLQDNHPNPARSTSIRRRTFRSRDSVTVPLNEFSQSDNSFVMAHRHPFWQIEAKLWPNNDSETDINVTFQLLQFIYQGVGNDSQDAIEIRDSKLRWFHVPMNNVSSHPELLRPMLIGLASMG